MSSHAPLCFQLPMPLFFYLCFQLPMPLYQTEPWRKKLKRELQDSHDQRNESRRSLCLLRRLLLLRQLLLGDIDGANRIRKRRSKWKIEEEKEKYIAISDDDVYGGTTDDGDVWMGGRLPTMICAWEERGLVRRTLSDAYVKGICGINKHLNGWGEI